MFKHSCKSVLLNALLASALLPAALAHAQTTADDAAAARASVTEAREVCGLACILERQKQALAGAWEVSVNPAQVPGAPAPFTAYFTYDGSGGFVETDPLAGGNGHGAWVGHGGLQFTFRMVRRLLAPDGRSLGTFKVIERITLVNDNEYRGEFSADFFDPAGNYMGTIPGTTRATRIFVP